MSVRLLCNGNGWKRKNGDGRWRVGLARESSDHEGARIGGNGLSGML